MKLRYLVQLADSFGFDFGGENGGIASFHHLGSAYAFADGLRKQLGRTLRVLDCSGRMPRQVYMLQGNESVNPVESPF